jgi:hypothetical protein
MTTLALLVDLRRRGLTLSPEGSALGWLQKALTPEIREAVRTHKADLLTALSVRRVLRCH